MTAAHSRRKAPSRSGWDTRLHWRWIAYNTIAFAVVLTVSFVLELPDDEVLHLDLAATMS